MLHIFKVRLKLEEPLQNKSWEKNKILTGGKIKEKGFAETISENSTRYLENKK